MDATQSVIMEISIINEADKNIIQYFQKFAAYINYIYRKMGISSMIEVVSNGFLLVLENPDEMKKALRIFKKIRKHANQKELIYFFHEFTEILQNDFKIEKNHPLTFKIEFLNVDTEMFVPLIEKYLATLSKRIVLQFSKQHGYYLWH